MLMVKYSATANNYSYSGRNVMTIKAMLGTLKTASFVIRIKWQIVDPH